MKKKDPYTKHAEILTTKLLMRPVLPDVDGLYDMYGNEKQIMEIIEQYLIRNFELKTKK